MSKKISITDLPEFDSAEHLQDEADIAAYLTAVIEEGDSSLRAHEDECAEFEGAGRCSVLCGIRVMS